MEDLSAHCTQLKREELAASLAGTPRPPPLGLLVFTCNGRGRALYRAPHYDTTALCQAVPVAPAGFFAAGEIGQVERGGATHLHAFTCAAGVLRPLTPATTEQQQEAGAGEEEDKEAGAGEEEVNKQRQQQQQEEGAEEQQQQEDAAREEPGSGG